MTHIKRILTLALIVLLSALSTPARSDAIALQNTGTPGGYPVIASPGGPMASTVLSPIPGNYVIPNDATSQWIRPNAGFVGVGNYVYRTTFDLTGLDPSTAVISGRWSTDNNGADILINGQSTGNTTDFVQFNIGWKSFTINGGFQPGINTLDFVVFDSGVITALRVELSGVAAVVPVAPQAQLLVTGANSDAVHRYSATTGASTGYLAPPHSGGLDVPRGIAVGPDGNVYVASTYTNSILRYHGTTGAFHGLFASASAPAGLTFGPDGNLYVNCQGTGDIRRFSGLTGAFLGVVVPHGVGGFDGGNGLVFGPDGNLYTTNTGTGAFPNTHSILRFSGTTGAFMGAFVPSGSGGLNQPAGMLFGPDGNLYVAKNHPGSSILRYDGVTGAFLDVFVSAASGGLDQPFDFAFGPDQNLYVTSLGTNQVLRYDGSTGVFLDAFVPAGSGGLNAPWGLVFTLPPNRAPVANAGPDQLIEAKGVVTAVLLDGSGSTDPDGGVLTYEWREGATLLGTGQSLGIALGLGSHSITLTVRDPGSLTASDTTVVLIRDTTPPALTLPPKLSTAATSSAGAPVSFSVSATDLVDGPVTPVVSPASGSVFPLGATTVSVMATDAAGNTALGSFLVTVAYSWSGVLQPINADGSSIFKLGRTVPVKFRLTGASAAITDAVASLFVAKISGDIAGSEVEAESTAAATGGNQFRYDAGADQYVFNLSTDGLTPGTYRLRINLGDGVLRTVDISLR